jgi:hypothetical protein
MSDGDLRVLAKLVVLLDSPQEGDATAAILRIRAFLRKSGAKFYEAVETRAFKTAIWEAMGHPECLREYFEAAQLRERCAKLEAECDVIAEALSKFRKAGKLCLGCEKKRRQMALACGGVVISAWCSAYPPHNFGVKTTFHGILLALLPILGVLCRWRLVNFKRDLEWVSLTDNKLYRLFAAKWNRLLGRLVLS